MQTIENPTTGETISQRFRRIQADAERQFRAAVVARVRGAPITDEELLELTLAAGRSPENLDEIIAELERRQTAAADLQQAIADKAESARLLAVRDEKHAELNRLIADFEKALANLQFDAKAAFNTHRQFEGSRAAREEDAKRTLRRGTQGALLEWQHVEWGKDIEPSPNAPASRWEVCIRDGSPLPVRAIVEAKSEGDAVAAFKRMAGIANTIHPITATPLEDF